MAVIASKPRVRKRVETALERTIFASRWLLAPFYLGLVLALGMLVVKFVQEILHILPHLLDLPESEMILAILSLIDLSLAGNLLLIVIFSGYENFVSKIGLEGHEDRPEWMGKVDFSGLKLKLIASIVAISGIHLLKAFMDVHDVTKEDLQWQIAIHVVFVLSGVMLALMDWLVERAHLVSARAHQIQDGGH
ncbi:TIGR00645 family protein [Arenibaculum pallidiluteum]|uniref:TIGR00645 family protein n=1 Tax=Arenibaculum pallidiluteum TaxID=2812559 RepID=UPI001B3B6AF0|nr:TIGR00645 family protein [Arenibaculum pallidiluteum]